MIATVVALSVGKQIALGAVIVLLAMLWRPLWIMFKTRGQFKTWPDKSKKKREGK